MERLFLPQPLVIIALMMAFGGPGFLVIASVFGPFVLLPDDAVLGIPAGVFEGLVLLLVELGSAVGLLAITKPLVFVEVDEHEVRMVSALGLVLPSFVDRIPRHEIFKVEGVTEPMNDGEVHRLKVYRTGIGPKTYSAPTESVLERAVALLRPVNTADSAPIMAAAPPSVEVASPSTVDSIAPWDQL